MNRLLSLAVLAVILSASPAAAQEPVDTMADRTAEALEEIVRTSGLESAVDSIARRSGPELEDALEQLTGTLNVLAQRIARDPELRASALRTAEGLVKLTEIVVAEQSRVLLEALRSASEEISATQHQPPA